MKPTAAAKLAAWGRVVTAVPLGYVSTALVVMALAKVLPGGPLQASVTAGLLSFLIYAALVIYIFAAASARQALLVTLAIGGAGAAISGLAIVMGGRL